MCCCARPNINGTPGYSWDGGGVGIYPVNPPALDESDSLLYDEPGRCGGMDSHSHHYRLVKNTRTDLLVRHGGGDERIHVSLPRGFSFDGIGDDQRYWLFNAIRYAHREGRDSALGDSDKVAAVYRKAFVDGRLKKRKLPAKGTVKVWIEPEEVARS